MKYRNILLIDDDEDDHEIFSLAIAKLASSIDLQGFNKPDEALKKLLERQIAPDVIFLDLNMPIMNGFSFLETIKKQDELKKIPVLIYSTSSNPIAKNTAKQLGAKDFITKPDTVDELVSILKDIVF